MIRLSELAPDVQASVRATRERVARLHAELPANGLVVWTAGNVSERVPGADLFAIKPSGVRYDELAADKIDLAAALADGAIRRDSYEDVVCDMVRYSIRQQVDGFAYGATQSTVTGGPYSQSSTFSAPVGSMSFTRVHRRRLGVRLSRFASVRTIGVRP